METKQDVKNLRLKLRGDTLTALLGGEIDHHSARELREVIDTTTRRVQPQELVLDFAAVQFMDSSGVGLVLGRCKLMQLWHGRVTVRNVPAKLQRIVSLAGLSAVCDVVEEEEPDEADTE